MAVHMRCPSIHGTYNVGSFIGIDQCYLELSGSYFETLQRSKLQPTRIPRKTSKKKMHPQ